jgi:hypothetical protein
MNSTQPGTRRRSAASRPGRTLFVAIKMNIHQISELLGATGGRRDHITGLQRRTNQRGRSPATTR